MNSNRLKQSRAAFSLIEVMIAIGILFICMFAILGVVSQGLRGARMLQRPDVDAGSVAAYFSITNKHEEIVESGSFDDLGDFPQSYNDYSWERECMEVGTNGLWKEIIIVTYRPNGNPVSSLERLVYDPASKGALSGGGATGGGIVRPQ
jgi:hypothetical protein